MNGEMAVTAIVHDLAPGESRELTRGWGHLDWAGLLPQGTYGIAISGELAEDLLELEEEPAEVSVFVTFAIR